jgi:pimeloyl-ACP methyl ester carboxylesterase
VAVDLRGFGRSDPITEPSLSMEILADDAAGLIDALGADQADVVGVSMGGYVALALWELRPEMVRSLTLMDTRAAADTVETRAARQKLIDALLSEGRSAVAGDMVASLLAPNRDTMVRARLRSMIEGTRYETMVAALDGMRNRPDRSALLASISVPSLIVGGDLDTLAPPAEMQALAGKIRGARTAIVAGAAHLPPMEQPDRTNEAVMELFEGRKVVWWRAEG